MKDGQERKPLDIGENGGKKNGSRGKKDGGAGIALGMCYGSALGLLGMAVTGEFWWVSIGVSLGLVLGLLFSAAKKPGKKDDGKDG